MTMRAFCLGKCGPAVSAVALLPAEQRDSMLDALEAPSVPSNAGRPRPQRCTPCSWFVHDAAEGSGLLGVLRGSYAPADQRGQGIN